MHDINNPLGPAARAAEYWRGVWHGWLLGLLASALGVSAVLLFGVL